MKLSSGDSLRFGTDIFRSKETFPPCVIDFYTLESEREMDAPSGDATVNRAFALYESDDGEDDNESDDDSIIETGMSTRITPTIPRSVSIDLTQDEDDCLCVSAADNDKCPTSTTIPVTSSAVIDLTSDAEEDTSYEGPSLEDPVREPESTNSESYILPPYRAPPVSECPPLLAAAIASHTAHYFPPAAEDMAELEKGSFADDQYSSDEDIDIADIAEQEKTLLHGKHTPDAVNFSDVDSAMTEDSISDISDEDVDVDVDVDVDAEEEDSATSETNEYAELYDSMDEDENVEDSYSDDDTSSSSDHSTDSLSDPSSPAPVSSPGSLFMQPVSKDATSADATAESATTQQSFVTPYLFTAAAENVSMDHPREPSPSDAALFKGRSLHDQEPSGARAQALGDKSGKHEFFQARESNRSSLMNSLPPPPVSALRETLSHGIGERSHEFKEGADSTGVDGIANINPWSSGLNSSQSKAADEPIDTVNTTPNIPSAVSEPQGATHVFKAPVATQDSTWSMSGERFINNPGNEDLPSLWESRPQSPEFDMTSAYTYQQSKMATESSTNQQLRRVGIPDLLEQVPNNNQDAANPYSPNVHRPHVSWRFVPVYKDQGSTDAIEVQTTSTSPQKPCGVKRLHDDAFADDDNDDDFYADWPSHEELLNRVKALTEEDVDAAPELSSAHTHTADPRLREAPLPQAEPTVAIPARRDDVQPSKRRRFAQAAACVALGGAAAFTFMVSTAPVL